MSLGGIFITSTARCSGRAITLGITVGRVGVSDVSLTSCLFLANLSISSLI